MTVPQIIMTFLAVTAVLCFVVSWLALTHERANRLACRFVYRWKLQYSDTIDEEICPVWADPEKWRT